MVMVVPEEVVNMLVSYAIWTLVYVCLPAYALTLVLFIWNIVGSMLPARVKAMYLVVLVAFAWFPPALFRIDEAIRRDETQLSIVRMGGKEGQPLG
jgi:hypothetical protein